MQTYTISDTSLAVQERIVPGDGPPVLFLHGFPFDHSIWNRTFDALGHCRSKTGNGQWRLIAPDLRGLGRSPLPDGAGPTTMEKFADDLNLLLEAMKVEEKIVLVGLSMGGYVAMQFARKYADQLAGLVLCDTKTVADPPAVAANRRVQAENLRTVPDFLPNFLKSVAETMIPNLFSEKTQSEKPEVVQELRTVIESNNPLGAAAATLGMAERPDTTEILRQLDVPVLVVCGSEDRFSPPEEMKPLAEIARQGRYVEIPDAGHLPPMEQPELFAEALAGFCDHSSQLVDR